MMKSVNGGIGSVKINTRLQMSKTRYLNTMKIKVLLVCLLLNVTALYAQDNTVSKIAAIGL